MLDFVYAMEIHNRFRLFGQFEYIFLFPKINYFDAPGP